MKLPTADESRALARVRLDSPVEISQLADMAGMPVSKLKTFNAGVKGSTLGASGPKYVMVPQKHAAQLRESLASGDIAAVQPTQLADNTPLTSHSYKVRSGDTISGIASRLGVTTRSAAVEQPARFRVESWAESGCRRRQQRATSGEQQ